MNAVSRAGLSAEGVAFGFGGREVLRDLSLKVAGGHVLGVLGRSGSGKSTLLHLLMGLLQEQQGTICLGGRPLTAAQRRGRGGYVPQKPSLLPWRTVLGNLRLPLEVGKRANRAGHDRASDEALYALLERFGLADAAQLWPQQLSGGMATKAAIILSTESVWGMIFSVVLAYEVLTFRMFIGAFIIFIAILLSEVRPQLLRKRIPPQVKERNI